MPASFVACRHLTILDLSNNSLVGGAPLALLDLPVIEVRGEGEREQGERCWFAFVFVLLCLCLCCCWPVLVRKGSLCL